MAKIDSRLEWFANLSPMNAPKADEETKYHRKVQILFPVLLQPR
jgi:hypothetical protein